MFLTRLSKVGTNEGLYLSDDYGFVGSDLHMPNCTDYSLRRSGELANKPTKKEMFPNGIGNAKTWWTTCRWAKGTQARVGAIGVWDGTLGHVAIVEEITDDGIVFSQSNYTSTNRNYNNPKFWELKTYNPIPNQVTKGVGLKFLGYIYNPHVDDKRVERNEVVKQVEIIADMLSVRKTPNGSKLKGLYIPKGIYNVLDQKAEGDYEWVQLDTETWCALKEGEWTKLYEAEPSQDWRDRAYQLSVELDTLKAEHEKLKNDFENNKKLLDEANNKLEKIREII